MTLKKELRVAGLAGQMAIKALPDRCNSGNEAANLTLQLFHELLLWNDPIIVRIVNIEHTRVGVGHLRVLKKVPIIIF